MTLKKVLAVLAGCGAIFAAMVAVALLEPQPVEITEKSPVKPPVSVVAVVPEAYTPSLTLLATTSARWPMQLKASSSAQLDWLDTDIEPGSLVKKGTLLARLNTSHLESQLAQANSEVKQAELNLKQQLHEQTVAVKFLSAKQSSPFARREPQVAAARADLARARQAFTSAEKLLREASITVPFDAVIIARHVSPGEWLEAGQTLMEIAASESLDIKLPVSEMHWNQVQPALEQPKIDIIDRQGQRWPAKVRYISPQVDPTTRQRQVVLTVAEPYSGQRKLLPNQQVQVAVTLGEQKDVAKLPLSAMTRDGFVWTLASGDHLQKEWVELVEQQGDLVFVRFSQQASQPRQVVLYPLLSMLAGKAVTPQQAEALLAKREAANELADPMVY